MNHTGSGVRAKREKYQELVGLSPEAFETIVAVVAAEKVTGDPVPSSELLLVLGFDRLPLAELSRGLWVTVEGKANGPKLLRARDRAWRELGVAKPGTRAA